MTPKEVASWARRNKARLKSEPEQVMADLFKLIHAEVKIPEAKRFKLEEIERRSVKLLHAYLSESEAKPISFEDGCAILAGHRRDAEAVYAAIGKDPWFDLQHTVVPGTKETFLASIDLVIKQLESAKSTNPHIVGFHPNIYPVVRRFNELATMQHLGQRDYKRYATACAAFSNILQKATGYRIN